MARMYSRKKGRSGSKKPLVDHKPTWQRSNDKEVEMIIVKHAKQGMNPSQIGLQLRDIYGVPSVKLTCKNSITRILKEKGMQPELPEDLFCLMKRCVMITKHLEKNKQDHSALRGLQITNSKIMKLAKYYKRVKRLPHDWKFDPDKIKLFVE